MPIGFSNCPGAAPEIPAWQALGAEQTCLALVPSLTPYPQAWRNSPEVLNFRIRWF